MATGLWLSPATYLSPTTRLAPRFKRVGRAYLIRRPGLGCGTYTVLAYERGGATIITELPAGSIAWGRGLSRTSEAKVTTTGLSTAAAADCCRRLRDILCWEAELHVYRSDQRVWLGPLVQRFIPEGELHAELTARDLSEWLQHRFARDDATYQDADLAQVALAVAQAGMRVDTTPNITLRAAAGAPTGDRTITASDYQMAGDVIDDLARSGLDWWCVKRVIQYGLGDPAPVLGVLTDEHFSERPGITDDGLSRVTRAVVKGEQPSPDAGAEAGAAAPPRITGDASQTSPPTGVLERAYDETHIQDPASATSAAKTHLASAFATPTVISGGQLDSAAPLDVAGLLPGGVFDVRVFSGCMPATGPHVLTELSGAADERGEKLSITLVAQSVRDDAAA